MLAVLHCVLHILLLFFLARSAENLLLFPLEEDMVTAGPCEVGGDARIPSKASGLGETMIPFYQLGLCGWSSERDWLRQECWVPEGHCQHQVFLKSDLFCCTNWVSWKWPGWLMWWWVGKAQQLIFKMTKWLRFTDSFTLHVSPEIQIILKHHYGLPRLIFFIFTYRINL